jgi:hypothetical protein
MIDIPAPVAQERKNYEQQELMYKQRQDEIVKKIQTNIKRSEELDKIAELRQKN